MGDVADLALVGPGHAILFRAKLRQRPGRRLEQRSAAYRGSIGLPLLCGITNIDVELREELGEALGVIEEAAVFDFCLSTSTHFDNKHIRSGLASRRSVSRRGPMAQGNSPHNTMAFASVWYPGRYLASQPIHLGLWPARRAAFQQAAAGLSSWPPRPVNGLVVGGVISQIGEFAVGPV